MASVPGDAAQRDGEDRFADIPSDCPVFEPQRGPVETHAQQLDEAHRRIATLETARLQAGTLFEVTRR